MKNEAIAQVMETPLGTVTLFGNGRALTGVRLSDKPMATISQLKAGNQNAILKKAREQLGKYFKGKLDRFTVPIEMEGTPFQKKVWKALSSIPFGKTASYKDIAKMIGNPKAVRAVGTANGRNPLCIVVPCHRVIAHDGSLGGYTGGLSKKRYLLSLESDCA